MRKKAYRTIPAVKEEYTKIKCDICGADAALGRFGSGGGVCHTCCRDICKNHKKYDDDGSDYPDVYCTFCYELKFEGEFAQVVSEVEEDYAQTLTEIEENIKEASLLMKLEDIKKQESQWS